MKKENRRANLTIAMVVMLSVITSFAFETNVWADGYASVSEGVTVPSTVYFNQNFTISFGLKEVRGASKTFESVAVAIVYGNTTLFDFAMYNNVTIPAYGTWRQSPSNSIYSAANRPAGNYQVVIRGKIGGSWFDFDTTGSGVTPKTFYVANAPASDDHGNSCSTATVVSSNSNRSGTLTAGDYDYFRIDVPSSGTLTVYTTGGTDTYGYLKNSGCTNIVENDDATDSNFRMSNQPVNAGTYYVAVRHYYGSTGTGAYTLNIQFVAIP